ncbi:excinuclease ABC subunit A [Maize bushy stunt phytoplasma]|uniref:UvrABC system protein A n=1 Tax=Maize bushy stunt phytoplasma TaxID=202462 RepID=A0ABN4RYN4_9MOLU|nr:excinuclease ABC subunit UvrA [Maize bushy stunt phytoplasma]AOF54766.1 excinuclease ABC subunit A [Maize bushy stunt phytoplasma]
MKTNKHQFIKVRGARQNNLKNINIDIPKNKLVIITGLSGSGKSSLAFDTLYQEGKRRYVESLSAYARQFLGSFEKPDVDSIEGLSPSISIDQKTTSNNPRSTVGTITEIYDYLRLIYANIAVPFHPEKNIVLEKQTKEQMITKTNQIFSKQLILILAPIIERKKGTHQKTLEALSKDGFNRVMINDTIYLMDDIPSLSKNQYHNIYVVIDRFEVNSDNQTRLFEALEQALNLAQGKVFIMNYQSKNSNDSNKNENNNKNHQILKLNCNYHLEGINFDIPLRESRLFSFNTPLGACQICKGIGKTAEIDCDMILDYEKPLNKGAILIFKSNNEYNNFASKEQELKAVCNHYQIDMTVPLKKIDPQKLNIILYGSPDQIPLTPPLRFSRFSKNTTTKTPKYDFFEGIASMLKRRFEETTSEWLKKLLSNYMMEKKCKTCQGQRLNQGALLFKINNKNIYEITDLSIEQTLAFFQNLELSNEETKIINLALKEVINRLTFLQEIGLGYLSLSRSGATLSGGEAQRIRLATQIGSQLSGVLYVLDEPSIGLHQKDNDLLIKSLQKMRDLGNSLIVVEHDHDTMLASDYLIDIGPQSGILGGKVQAFGTPQEVMQNKNSLTGKYLSKQIQITVPKTRRKGNKDHILVTKASKNNLKSIDVCFPMQQLIVVTGVSGSGKSTLVNDVLLDCLQQKYSKKNKTQQKDFSHLVNDFNKVKKIVEISQDPIGKTPRSNPLTYTGVFDEIRELYSKTKEAQMKGYKKGRFSFNVKGGRCEACSGDGVKKISMHFLPDVYVMCEACKGTRYQKETLSIKYKDKTIADILAMSVEEGVLFFQNHPKIKHQLEILQNVGLGYIKLGQSSPTLSGGEAQRVKLASELQKKVIPGALYILDEPTTGLHSEDVRQLLKVLHQMTDQKATIVVIEHNLDVIKNADYIIDLGPEGGICGGYVVATGTPEQVSQNEKSYTGKYLKKILNEEK